MLVYPMKKNMNQLEAIVHFVIARSFAENLGATKLNKVLWLADQISWRETGETITGLRTYKRMPFGPVPPNIDDCLASLKSKAVIEEFAKHTPVGILRDFRTNIEPKLEKFTAKEVDTISRALAFILPMAATEVSELTHDAYWDELENGDDMFVDAAALWVGGHVDDKSLDWAAREISELTS